MRDTKVERSLSSSIVNYVVVLCKVKARHEWEGECERIEGRRINVIKMCEQRVSKDYLQKGE